jgi:glycosyltransferase involved in cell wall biosynthesis
MDQTVNADPSVRARPLVAFFDYPDVFEDFYSHYGVDQQSFGTRWMDTAVHGWVRLVQRQIGDVIWYVLSLAPELPQARHEGAGCLVKFLPSGRLHRWLWRAFYLPRAAWRWRAAYRQYATVASYVALASWPLLRTLWRDRPDVIFAASYASGRFDVLLLIARLLRVPLLVLHTGGTPDGYLGGFIRRWTIRHSHWIFPSGNDELKMLVHRYGVRRDRLEVIRPCVDTAVFRPLDRATACRAVGLDSKRRYLLFVGRFDDSMKRVSSIIHAFAGLAGTHLDTDLILVGDGRNGPALRSAAAPQANRIHFLGWVSSGEAKAQIYNTAECLILASVREASPAVINESFACGTPVVSSKVGAVADLVMENETGWLFPAGDDKTLEAKLLYVLDHPEQVASMRPKVRKVAEEQLSLAAVAATLSRGFAAAIQSK